MLSLRIMRRDLSFDKWVMNLRHGFLVTSRQARSNLPRNSRCKIVSFPVAIKNNAIYIVMSCLIFAASRSHSGLIVTARSNRCLRRFGSGCPTPSPPPNGFPEPNHPHFGPIFQFCFDNLPRYVLLFSKAALLLPDGPYPLAEQVSKKKAADTGQRPILSFTDAWIRKPDHAERSAECHHSSCNPVHPAYRYGRSMAPSSPNHRRK